MADAKQKTFDPEILALSADVGQRFDAVDWQFYNDEELAYRNRARSQAFSVDKDFDRIAKADPQLAAMVWDNHVPSFVQRPRDLPEFAPDPEPENKIEPGRPRRKPQPQAYLDPAEANAEEQSKVRPPVADQAASPVDDVQQPSRERGQPAPSARARKSLAEVIAEVDRTQMLLDGLDRQYLRVDDRYHFRDRGREVAFEAQEKKLVTAHDTPVVVNSMIDLAEAKGWSSLKLTGTADFKREAWLQASLRDFEVSGYRPNAIDKARLEELRAERSAVPSAKDPNVMAEVTKGTTERKEPAGFKNLAPTEAHEPPLALTKPQDQAVAAMEVMMRSRGDSPRAISMARAELTERLRSDRVYVGKLVEVGTAPYQDRAHEKPSHFVTLENDQGQRYKVWGVDLPRALEASGAQPGEKIALAFKGRQTVTVDDPIKDDTGKTVRVEKKDVDRNSWDIVGFDRLRESSQVAVTQAADRANKPGELRVFDRSAPSRAPQQAVDIDRPRVREHGR